ncbi:hypothetical protein GY45DRAFT_1100545 [Cubamyces sp. BRFM 1775]|nr:hypothetical protein GY45DRAFT_1100545 [Cubamyces sp. BRFM 1775]
MSSSRRSSGLSTPSLIPSSSTWTISAMSTTPPQIVIPLLAQSLPSRPPWPPLVSSTRSPSAYMPSRSVSESTTSPASLPALLSGNPPSGPTTRSSKTCPLKTTMLSSLLIVGSPATLSLASPRMPSFVAHLSPCSAECPIESSALETKSAGSANSRNVRRRWLPSRSASAVETCSSERSCPEAMLTNSRRRSMLYLRSMVSERSGGLAVGAADIKSYHSTIIICRMGGYLDDL